MKIHFPASYSLPTIAWCGNSWRFKDKKKARRRLLLLMMWRCGCDNDNTQFRASFYFYCSLLLCMRVCICKYIRITYVFDNIIDWCAWIRILKDFCFSWVSECVACHLIAFDWRAMLLAMARQPIPANKQIRQRTLAVEVFAEFMCEGHAKYKHHIGKDKIKPKRNKMHRNRKRRKRWIFIG